MSAARWSLLMLIPVVACDTNEIDQLEDFEVTYEGEPAEDGYRGLATVDGDAKDWTLSLADTELGSQELTMHVPGQSDLSTLDGRELSIELEWSLTPTAVVSDAEGLVFASVAGDNHPDVVAALGSDFISFGEEAGSVQEGTDRWSLRYAVVSTDEGTLELLPGEAEEITVDGTSWRVVVHAAYQVEPGPLSYHPCGFAPDMLTFEVLRLDAPAASELIGPSSSRELPLAGCN